MKIKIPRRTSKFSKKYPQSDLATARKFGKKVYKEMGTFIVALALFGSSARGNKKAGDIDIIVIIDDVHVELNRELVETYRIIMARCISAVDPKRLHVQTVNLTTFWEYVRSGDPVAINILRDSIAILDTGFFDPLQILLFNGRIRPTHEAVWTYYAMAPASLERAATKIDLAVIDLYWAVIDAAHAALMAIGEIPPSPSHVADMMEEKLVKPGYMTHRYATIMRHMYEVSRRVMHRQAHGITGEKYDQYRRLAEIFVHAMNRFIKKHGKNL